MAKVSRKTKIKKKKSVKKKAVKAKVKATAKKARKKVVVKTRKRTEMMLAEAPARELSGAAWVARYPDARSVASLVEPFRTGVTNFIAALNNAQATISINSTLRPVERAYLMHWSFQIVNGTDPQTVPAMAGVNIEWWHGNLNDSRNAAQVMVNGYHIAYLPALNSRHTQGLAIDMTVTWNSSPLRVREANGTMREINSGAMNTSNPALHAVGATFGVIKLVNDPPHWSSDGH